METASLFNTRVRTIIIIIAIIVVFIVPYAYHVDLGPGPNGFFAILWEIPDGRNFMILTAFEYFIYYLYRLVVLNALWKFTLGKMSRKRLMLHGLVAEIIPVLLSIPAALFLSSEGENFLPISIPISILLMLTSLVVFYDMKRE